MSNNIYSFILNTLLTLKKAGDLKHSKKINFPHELKCTSDSLCYGNKMQKTLEKRKITRFFKCAGEKKPNFKWSIFFGGHN